MTTATATAPAPAAATAAAPAPAVDDEEEGWFTLIIAFKHRHTSALKLNRLISIISLQMVSLLKRQRMKK